MTRSHHFSSTEIDELPAIHIAGDLTSMKRSWCNLIQNVYRRSLSSGPDLRKRKVFVRRDPQGLRRPRFSFFIFTCQTARGQNPSPMKGDLSASHSTANDNRWRPAVDSLILVRSITGTESCLGQGPKQRRAQWSGYKPPRSGLSTPVVNKSSHRGIDSCSAKKPPIFKDFTPYLSHNPATF